MSFLLRLITCSSSSHAKRKTQSANRAALPPLRLEARETECAVCMEETQLMKMHGHSGPLCVNCFRNDMKHRITEAGNLKNLTKCPCKSCEQPLSLADLQGANCSALVQQKFTYFTKKEDPNWSACPFCCTTLELTPAHSANPRCTCASSTCGKEFCVTCKVAWHEKQTCAEFQAKLKKKAANGADELDSLAKRRGWSKCPTCSVWVEKIAGCSHMSHMNACQSHWCGECGVELMPDGGTEKNSTNAVRHWNEHGCRVVGTNHYLQNEVY